MPKKKEKKLLGLEDERFAHLRSDPKFSGLSNREKKVTIGKRFAAALTDDKFANHAKVDKYGRRVRRKGGVLGDLYQLEDSEEEDEEQESSTDKAEKEESGEARKGKNSASTQHDDEGKSDENPESDEEEDDDAPIKLDLARGEGNVSSSEDDDSDSDSEGDGGLQIELDLAHLDDDAEQVEWSSSRLAACNLDWNLVHCEDLMVIAKSFTPPGGAVKRIAIYLSDFGAERLEEEDKYGPRLQLSKPIDEYDGGEMDEETKLAMRKYQVDQLRYYYAVIECDSVKTAEAIYAECDGYQFESSNLKMDLRFVPDDMEFDKDRIKEELCDGDVNVSKYKSKEKLKSSVTQTNACIGWDETEELRSRKFTEAFKNRFSNDEDAARDLIACSDDEEDEEAEKKRQALLSLLGNKEEVDGLEKEDGEQEEEEDESDDDHIDVKKNNKVDEEEKGITTIAPKKKQKNTYQAYMERKKLKKAERKQALREKKEKDRMTDVDAMKDAEAQAKIKQKENRAALRAIKEKEDKDGSLVEAVAIYYGYLVAISAVLFPKLIRP
ncbi:unnamed protein product [Nippostrongylus brasiliensis]|uniref:NUC153 domain-containing protein n=1 Tax=Nippostrongylus brasiliensis TaxID=27835 RepID=A0A0N4Y0L5_NIPBR|nr:unnamed protein product [Nippostrongylus brasiliensis]